MRNWQDRGCTAKGGQNAYTYIAWKAQKSVYVKTVSVWQKSQTTIYKIGQNSAKKTRSAHVDGQTTTWRLHRRYLMVNIEQSDRTSHRLDCVWYIIMKRTRFAVCCFNERTKQHMRMEMRYTTICPLCVGGTGLRIDGYRYIRRIGIWRNIDGCCRCVWTSIVWL